MISKLLNRIKTEGLKGPISSLNIRNLSLFYDAKPAFEEISLTVNNSSVTAIVGPSGSGKTSLLRCINRLTDLIPGTTTSGAIYVNGSNILKNNVNLIELRRKIGMVFQHPNPFPLSIRQNLILPLKEHGVADKNNLNQKVESALNQVGLWDEVKDRLDSTAHSLSGGQMQRLCIARSIVLEPDVLLMDEPCGSLDPLSSAIIEEKINELKTKYTIVIVTHNLAQAKRLADHVAVMWNINSTGRLIEYGTVGNVFESPKEELTIQYIKGLKG